MLYWALSVNQGNTTMAARVEKRSKKIEGCPLITVRCKSMRNITGKESGELGWNAVWERKRQVKGCARRLKFIRGLVKHRKD